MAYGNIYNQPSYPAPQMQGNLTAAKSYPVAPGQLAVLIDTEDPVIYTKTTDQFGRPLPIKVLDYKERVPASPIPATTSDNYLTKDEFASFKDEIMAAIKESTRQNRPNNFKRPERKEE